MIDYNKYLDNRVVIISGVGRSGTTILGKIIGSAKNTFYFFEPAIMKYFPGMYIAKQFMHDQHNELIRCFKSTLFEDYILPAVQGRNINLNEKDWSYYGNYFTYDNLINRWNLNRRQDALDWIEQAEPLFVFKVNESSHLFDFYNEVFNGLRIINIKRDMIRTVYSSIKRGWFQDDYEPIDLTYKYDTKNLNIPIYIERKYIEDWIFKWNPETRSIYTWARLNYFVDKYKNDYYIKTIFYENFCDYPNDLSNMIFKKLNLKKTYLTDWHIQSVKNHIDIFDESKRKEIEDKIMIDINQETYEVSER